LGTIQRTRLEVIGAGRVGALPAGVIGAGADACEEASGVSPADATGSAPMPSGHPPVRTYRWANNTPTVSTDSVRQLGVADLRGWVDLT
jgi:hypothetical protein